MLVNYEGDKTHDVHRRLQGAVESKMAPRRPIVVRDEDLFVRICRTFSLLRG